MERDTVVLISAGTAMQALGKYSDTAIDGSERIEEDFELLKGKLDLDQPLVFHVGLDVRQPHSWKSPYQDIKVGTFKTFT